MHLCTGSEHGVHAYRGSNGDRGCCFRRFQRFANAESRFTVNRLIFILKRQGALPFGDVTISDGNNHFTLHLRALFMTSCPNCLQASRRFVGHTSLSNK